MITKKTHGAQKLEMTSKMCKNLSVYNFMIYEAYCYRGRGNKL